MMHAVPAAHILTELTPAYILILIVAAHNLSERINILIAIVAAHNLNERIAAQIRIESTRYSHSYSSNLGILIIA